MTCFIAPSVLGRDVWNVSYCEWGLRVWQYSKLTLPVTELSESVHIYFLISQKWYFFQKKRMDLYPETYIYLKSVSPGECDKNIYMATPISAFKESQKWYFCQKKNGATGLKLLHADKT